MKDETVYSAVIPHLFCHHPVVGAGRPSRPLHMRCQLSLSMLKEIAWTEPSQKTAFMTLWTEPN